MEYSIALSKKTVDSSSLGMEQPVDKLKIGNTNLVPPSRISCGGYIQKMAFEPYIVLSKLWITNYLQLDR